MLRCETAPVRQFLVSPVCAGRPSTAVRTATNEPIEPLRNVNSLACAGSLGQDMAGRDARKIPGSAGLSTAFPLTLFRALQSGGSSYLKAGPHMPIDPGNRYLTTARAFAKRNLDRPAAHLRFSVALALHRACAWRNPWLKRDIRSFDLGLERVNLFEQLRGRRLRALQSRVSRFFGDEIRASLETNDALMMVHEQRVHSLHFRL